MEDTFHLGIKALIRNKNGDILLLKVNPKKLVYRKDWKGVAYWDIPGGRIKKNISIEKTLKREVKEETGITQVSKIKPFSTVLSKIRIPIGKESVGLILSAYTCEVPINSKIKLSEEHVEARWFNPKKAALLLKVKYPGEFVDKIKELGSGETRTKPILFQKIAAHGFIENKGKYLITRRSLVNDYKPGEWDIPGGTIEFGEDPFKALVREIREESGLKVKIKKPLYIYSFISNPTRHQFQIVYECEYISGEVKLNPEEHDKFVWVTIPEIAKLKKIAFLKNFYKDVLNKD